MPEDVNQISKYLVKLRIEHREIDHNLKRLTKFKYVDQLQIQTLKRQKLRLKDQISRLESELIPDILA